MSHEQVIAPEKIQHAPSSSSSVKNHDQEPPIGMEQGALMRITSFSGSIPPPTFLVQYEKMVPGIAKKFLEQPHLEAEHRRELDKLLVHEQIKLSKRGQMMAFTLAAGCVIGAFGAF